VSLRYNQYEDTLIGALWAVGMAVGILFIYKTPGYNVDLMSYLFGNILMVEKESVRLLAYLDGLIILSVLLFYKRFLAVCFDEEYSKLQGVGVVSTYLLLLCLIALTVVILIQVVGIILVIALLTLPAATARYYSLDTWSTLYHLRTHSILPAKPSCRGHNRCYCGAGLPSSHGPQGISRPVSRSQGLKIGFVDNR
jgi:ABC-type Mn2+/Zn2+ transport system permease subunit